MNHHHHENMPPWARRVDNYGRQHWEKELKTKSRRGEYIASIIFNLIFLWIVNKVPEWHIPFIKDSYMVVLWILYTNILIRIGAAILMLVFETTPVRRLGNIITEAAGFVTTLVLYYIYPFDFQNFHGLFWMDWLLPIIFIIGMVVSAMKVFSNGWKLLFWR